MHILALYKAEERSARLKGGPRPSQRYTRQTEPTNRLQPTDPSNARKTSDCGQNSTNGETLNAVNRTGSVYKPKNKRKQSTDRTTRLLIVILVLFLLTEFPQVLPVDLHAYYE